MKMNKVALSLAGVLAAAAFAPEASAVPVFARQTGMACSACHFNHFPLLNSFGRAFKSSGYTLMGSQGKVEGEDLSIPDRLNMAMLATAGHQSVGNAASGAVPAAGDNGWFVPGAGGELSLFVGGKVTDMAGFLSEFAIGNPTMTTGFNAAGTKAGTAAGASVGAASGKLLIMPEVADNTHAGLVLYQIGQGPAGSFELMSTGATSIHKMMGNPGFTNAAATGGMDHLSVTSARQFLAPEKASTGISLVVANPEKYFINYSRYAAADANAGVTSAQNLPGQYIRAAYFFDLAGFDSGIGIQNFSGKQNVTTNLGALALGEYRATIIDFQMQGDLGGNGFGFYASYGRAPKSNVGAGANNPWNVSTTDDSTSLNIGADYTVMPKVTIQGAIRSGKVSTGAVAGTQTDNAFMIGAAYELAMNQHLAFNYTANSGAAWDTTGVNKAVAGKTQSTVLLEQLF